MKKNKNKIVLSKEAIDELQEDIFVIQDFLSLFQCAITEGSNLNELLPKTLYITDVALDRVQRIVTTLCSLPMNCNLIEA